MKILTRIISALSILLAPACSSPTHLESSTMTSRSQSWDVNDISILYPIKNIVTRDDPGRLVYLHEGQGLISEMQFQSILDLFYEYFGLDFSQGAQAKAMNRRERWAVLGIRIDHCFRRQFSDACEEQVRVVAQAVTADETNTTDFALHLFYKPEQSTVELLRELIRIRETYAGSDSGLTLGKPLGVHPILAKRGGLNSKYAEKLKQEFLLRFLNPNNLSEIAVSFIEPERLQPWIFFMDNAQHISRPQLHSIFTFDPQNSPNRCGVRKGRLICQKDFRTGQIIDSDEKASTNPNGETPAGRTPDGKPYLDDFLSLMQKDPDTRRFSSVTNRLSYWEGVFNEVDNPELTAPGETNCSSCHRTTPDRVRFRAYFKFDTKNGLNAYRPESDSGCTPGVGIDYDRIGMKTFTVRMFGYMHEHPIIGQRVVNETLAVCQHLKRVLQ